ncbi:2Fe-2S iron-sulfur cluster-binding protein [Bacterioplanoides sp.]|uniref:2Fe-2S iron-sulfur cluster-binding protein n=1 Tax=Bacterioplanoides sp. TaxID=2066072 RepID=UPI003B00041C
MFSFFQKNKKPHTANINGQTIEVKPQETLLNAALRHDIEFPYSCRVGGCAACKCQLTAGKVKELTDAGYILSDEDLDNGYILACQSVPDTDISIHLDLPQQSVEQTTGKVIAQKRLTHDITELVVRTDTPVSYQPGQFADLTLASLPGLARSYSFASVPSPPASSSGSVSNRPQSQKSTLSFFVREVPGGRFSGAVNQKDLSGERIDIKGPLGDFWLRTAQNPIIMIAGGSGLAPVIAMLEAEVQQSRHRPLLLLFGARSQQDLYALERIDNIRRHWHASFEFIPVLSDEADTSDWNGKRGLVSDFIQPALLPDSHAYLCGPPAMIDAAETVLKNLGVSAQHIYADRFITVDAQKAGDEKTAIDVKKSA